MSKLLKHKDYFIATLKDRKSLKQAGFQTAQITVPVEEPDNQESWDKYLHGLSFTLNYKLCVLELRVGFAHLQMIRFSFEKNLYIRVSGKFPQISAEIANCRVTVKEDPATLFVK